MGISLRLPEISEPVTRKFKIPANLSEQLDKFIEAAQEQNPTADENLVMQAILEKTLKKDRGFRTWLKRNNGGGKRKVQNEDQVVGEASESMAVH